MRSISLFILAALLCASPGYSQIIPASQAEIGVRSTDSKPVVAKQYAFKNYILQIEPGSDDQSVILALGKPGKGLGGSGRLACVDLSGNSYKWGFDIRKFDIGFSRDVIIYNNKDGNHFFSKSTGKKLFRQNAHPAVIEERNNLLLSPGVEAVSMEDGKVKWKSKVDSRYGWNDMYYVDDTTLYLAVGGVHRLNLNNGQGWHYGLSTGKDDYSAAVVSGVVGGLLFGVMGSALLMSATPKTVSGMASYLVYDSLSRRVWFASYEKLVCLDANGKLVWQHEFPKGEASNSVLIREKDRILMLNKGLAFYNNGRMRKGNPFIASFDMNTGKQDYFRVFAKDDYVYQYGYQHDTLLAVTSGQLLRFAMKDGSTIAERKLNTYKTDIDPSPIDHSRYYLKGKDSIYQSLDQLGAYNYLITAFSRVLTLNDSLELTDTTQREDTYIKISDYGPYQIVHSSVTTVILDQGKALIRLGVSGESRVIGDRLLISKDDKLYVLELKDVLSPVENN